MDDGGVGSVFLKGFLGVVVVYSFLVVCLDSFGFGISKG